MNPSDIGRHATRHICSTSLVVLLAAGIVAPCCGDGSSPSAEQSTDANGATSPLAGDLTVSAAASLKESFTRIANDFEEANPDVEITINFGSSGELATQIRSGAPVDVAAFAAESTMATLADAGLLDGESRTFATNELVIVTEPGNPRRIDGLPDLATAGTVSLCADPVPCGGYAEEILTNAGVSIPADRITRGHDVRSTLAAVAAGDADAGIVYVTDASAAGDAVDVVQIPTGQNALARYPIAVVEGSANPTAAAAFEDYVLGPEAQDVLTTAGFGPP